MIKLHGMSRSNCYSLTKACFIREVEAAKQ
jgi:hypothetical protein